jgi:hypothetical protein
MSYTEEEVKISNKLTKIEEKVDFDFEIPQEYLNIKEIIINIEIILDIVFSKEKIEIKPNKIEIKNNRIFINIDNFPLNNIEENKIMNIGTLNFYFLNKENNTKFMERILILQIVKEKGTIYKNII